jgi:S-adenosylmethionine hydrolase
MIALFTDFGLEGPYIGQINAVLAEQCPQESMVCIFSDLPTFNAHASAYLLPPYTTYLPIGTICLCVVDPGVGSDRKGLMIKADGRWFVGPDNGLFSCVVRHAVGLEIYQITWVPDQLSNSFHGRDLFAPVAAKLARGESVPGEVISPDEICLPDWPDDLFEVVYIDHFGNAITGIRANKMVHAAVLEVNGKPVAFARTFSETELGAYFWYENSNGLVEIAANQVRADELLSLSIGSTLSIIQDA